MFPVSNSLQPIHESLSDLCIASSLPSETMDDAVTKKNAQSLYEQGQRCYKGGDFNEGVKLYTQASDLGNADAMVALGECVLTGLGTRKIPQEAVDLFQKAVLQNCSQAMTKLALCCFRGEGIARSVNAGIELLRKAVDLNNEEAILHLFVHRLGISEGELQYSSSDARLCRVPYESFREQFDKVLFRHFPEEETLQKAVGLGNVMAMVLLANRYFSQREVDGTRAVELYRNAVVYDVPEALAGLGHCYRKGVGVPRDHTTANQLFQRAAAAGHVGYMRYLAKRFISGTDPNILQDGNRGVQLYQQLCDRGSKRGIRNFGLLYEKGIEVQKDYRYAAKLFQRAAEMGDRYAVRCLQRCTEPRSAAECAFFEL